MMRDTIHTPKARGAAMLLGVMLLVASATLAASAMIVEFGSRDRSRVTHERVERSRAAARSLIHGILAELSDQREDVLAGATPSLDSARLLTVEGPGGTWAARTVGDLRRGSLTSEAALLNLNTASREMLEAVMSPDEADAVIGARPLESVRQGAAAAGVSMREPWTALVTVLSADPGVALGLRLEPGEPRLAEIDPQSPPDAYRAFVEETGFDPLDGDTPPSSRASLYSTCLDSGVDASVAADALDLLTFSTEPSVGLIDLNTASEEVLRAVPGIDEEVARDIVQTRERLSESERRAETWPVREGIAEGADWLSAIPWITTRSVQWGLTVEAGLLAGDGEDASAAPLEYPVRYRLVIDAAGAPARLILIRDETNGVATIPPPLEPAGTESAVGLLEERASRTPRPTRARPTVNRGDRGVAPADPRPAASEPSGGPVIRRDRAGANGGGS
ncbi:MAG: ComEA family DNA-binding protein [Phycisphaerales bacterium JB040]